MILLCKRQRGIMPHTKELVNPMENCFMENKRWELKPDKPRFEKQKTKTLSGIKDNSQGK